MNKQEIVEAIGKGAGATLCFLAILAMGACLPPAVAHATPTDTPEITQMVEATSAPTPTLKPTATPAPTENPTPTPMPELTFEQKKALLGIKDGLGPYIAAQIAVFNISFETPNGNIIEGRVFCGYRERQSDFDQENCFNLSNGTYLFTYSYNGAAQIPSTEIFKHLTEEYSPNLKNLKLKDSTSLPEMAIEYNKKGLNYLNNSFLNNLSNLLVKDLMQAANVKITYEELIKLIIESTPQEEIIPFWTYTPGAKIPEELKGLYSEVDYPPAALPAPIPQSNKIDRNVTHGYANTEYFNQKNTGSQRTVTAVNHSYHQYTKTKI